MLSPGATLTVTALPAIEAPGQIGRMYDAMSPVRPSASCTVATPRSANGAILSSDARSMLRTTIPLIGCRTLHGTADRSWRAPARLGGRPPARCDGSRRAYAPNAISRDEPEERIVISDLVLANRILYARGVVDGFGHVSVRDRDDPERFLLARNMAPALVRKRDIMRFTHDGTAVDDDRPSYIERFIHGSIYRARPDVGAVVHSHSAAVIPFGIAAGVELRPVFHMASFLRGPIPVWEIRDAVGPDNDMLVRDEATGDSLAHALGDGSAVLMRGHGSTAVGRDVREAVFRAVYTEINARLQAEALRLGSVTPLSEREAERSAISNAGQIARAWELWSREAAK